MASSAIDVIIINCLWLSVTLYFALPINEQYLTSSFNINNQQGWLIASLVGYHLAFTVPLLYFAFFECSSISSSPGKYLLNLKVVPESGCSNSVLDGVKRGIFILLFAYGLDAIAIHILKLEETIFIGLTIFSVLIPLMTYPAFRGNRQGFIDLLSDKLVIDRDSLVIHERIPPLSKLEQVIYSGRHLSTSVIWLTMSFLVLLVPIIPLFLSLADSKISSNLRVLALFALAPFCWLVALFCLWKFRGRLLDYFARITICLLPLAFLVAFCLQLPNSMARIQATPRVLVLTEQAIQAKEAGREGEYKSLCQQARTTESFATSYFGMPFLLLDTLNFHPDRIEFKKRLAVLSSVKL
ncbi:hypothetical protein BH11CYA1_BH11CYA1_41670 [soil metagenome]